jgi:hypothetical protein
MRDMDDGQKETPNFCFLFFIFFFGGVAAYTVVPGFFFLHNVIYSTLCNVLSLFFLMSSLGFLCNGLRKIKSQTNSFSSLKFEFD